MRGCFFFALNNFLSLARSPSLSFPLSLPLCSHLPPRVPLCRKPPAEHVAHRNRARSLMLHGLVVTRCLLTACPATILPIAVGGREHFGAFEPLPKTLGVQRLLYDRKKKHGGKTISRDLAAYSTRLG